MNALYIFILFLSGLFGDAASQSTAAAQFQQRITPVKETKILARNVHRFNPKTVVALEDTHFRPSK